MLNSWPTRWWRKATLNCHYTLAHFIELESTRVLTFSVSELYSCMHIRNFAYNNSRLQYNRWYSIVANNITKPHFPIRTGPYRCYLATSIFHNTTRSSKRYLYQASCWCDKMALLNAKQYLLFFSRWYPLSGEAWKVSVFWSRERRRLDKL